MRRRRSLPASRKSPVPLRPADPHTQPAQQQQRRRGAEGGQTDRVLRQQAGHLLHGLRADLLDKAGQFQPLLHAREGGA